MTAMQQVSAHASTREESQRTACDVAEARRPVVHGVWVPLTAEPEHGRDRGLSDRTWCWMYSCVSGFGNGCSGDSERWDGLMGRVGGMWDGVHSIGAYGLLLYESVSKYEQVPESLYVLSCLHPSSPVLAINVRGKSQPATVLVKRLTNPWSNPWVQNKATTWPLTLMWAAAEALFHISSKKPAWKLLRATAARGLVTHLYSFIKDS